MPKPATPMPAGAVPASPPSGQSPEEMLAAMSPMLKEADRMAAEYDAEQGAAEGAPAEGAPAEGAPAEGGPVDLTPLKDALDVDDAQAKRLYDAAMQIPQFAKMDVPTLADALSRDFEARMQVENMAARSDDNLNAEGEFEISEGLPEEKPPEDEGVEY